MRAEIEAAFPVCRANNCISETTCNPILIEDVKSSKCVITTNPASAHFTIRNTNNKNITFIAIDKCIWGDDSGNEKCDFAVTDSSVCAFVEIKNTRKRIPDHKKKAKDQLEESIKRFSIIAALQKTKRVAIIAWKYIPSRPVASTAMQSAAVHFWNTYNVELLEGNEMSF